MWCVTYTIEEPEMAGRKTTDGQGRLFLGAEFADKEIEYAVTVVGEKEDE